MSNKFFSLFTKEIRFGWRIIVVFMLIFLNVYSWNRITMTSAELKKIGREKMFISSISFMEQELNALESRQKLSKPEPDLSVALPKFSGIWIQDNSPVALVGDDILKEGDSVGQFIISKITENKVILTDKLTNLTKEIDF